MPKAKCSLALHLSDVALHEPEKVSFVRQIFLGLAALHRLGITHRDIKVSISRISPPIYLPLTPLFTPCVHRSRTSSSPLAASSS